MSRRSSKKVMGLLLFFLSFDAKEMLLIDYFNKGRPIHLEYYCNLLDQLDIRIHERRPGLHHKKLIFYQDNTRGHKTL